MGEIFETFKPKNTLVAQYVDYYYLDLKPNNIETVFECFPHFNNTISLYKSHFWLKSSEIIFDNLAEPFQIFTAIRENILKVKQTGPVHRVVIVFKPLGIHQFFRGMSFSSDLTDIEFFTRHELKKIFSTMDLDSLANLLDNFLNKRFKEFYHPILNRSVQYIFKNPENFSVSDISTVMGISRQHLNRVFKSYLGVSIKKLHEIVTFRQTVNKKLFENPDSNFTKIAYEFNYSDQSHLNRMYKNFTENSPKSFFSKGKLLGREDTFWHIQE